MYTKYKHTEHVSLCTSFINKLQIITKWMEITISVYKNYLV